MAKWRVGETDMQVQGQANGEWMDCEIIGIGSFHSGSRQWRDTFEYKIMVTGIISDDARPNEKARLAHESWLRKRPRQQDTKPAESEFIEDLKGWLKQREEA